MRLLFASKSLTWPAASFAFAKLDEYVVFYAIYSCVFPGRLSFYDYYSISVKNVNDPLALRIPPSHRKNPGHRQRETTNAKVPRFAKLRSLPKENHERKVSPFRKAQVVAKEKPRAQSFPISQSPGRCQRKTTSTKFPRFVKPRSLPRKNPWQTRAFFAMASLRSTPGKRGTSAPGRKSSLLLSSEVKG